MGVLYIADNILAPSHLWMRRMLEGLGEDVSVLATQGDPGPEYRRRYRCIGLTPTLADRILRRAGLNVAWTPRGLKLRRVMQSSIVSAILVHYLTVAVGLEAIWRATAKPVFVHCHGWDVTWNMQTCDMPRRPVHPGNYVERVRSLPENVCFIANSRETKNRLLHIGISDSRIYVKYLGVEVPPEPPTRSPRSGTLRLLYLGRLVDCKGPELVIRAFELASDQGMDGELTIAGDGPMRLTCEILRAHSPYADRIKMLGAVDRQTGEALRKDADVFCAHNCAGPITLQEEAFGVTIVEAMAAGLPVVSARSGSLPEVLEDGKQGILVEPGDVKAQAEAFIRLANDPSLREQMGRSGWERARKLFSIEQEIARLREIIGLPDRSMQSGRMTTRAT